MGGDEHGQPRRLARLAGLVAAKGAAFLDGPVSGSIVTLEQGQLSIIVGGDAAALERVRPYLLAIGPTSPTSAPWASP